MKKCRSYIAISLAIALIIGGITIQTWAGEKGNSVVGRCYIRPSILKTKYWIHRSTLYIKASRME